ncbi:hypothetical protein AVEN_254936-1, partial [Araneus ventricosus]
MVGLLTPYVGFNVQQAQYTTDLQRNQVLNLEPSSSEADTLPLGYHGLEASKTLMIVVAHIIDSMIVVVKTKNIC